MLIKALCDYYDNVLIPDGKALGQNLSYVDISYMVALNPDGTIDTIIDWKDKEEVVAKNGKTRTNYKAKREVFPKRYSKTSIDAEVVDHRPLYVFGFEYDKKEGCLLQTKKSQKSHQVFKDKMLDFLEGFEEEDIIIYKRFIENWNPENELENETLKLIMKSEPNAYFSFCVSGYPDRPIHRNRQIIDKWTSIITDGGEDEIICQCAITGEMAPIARIHEKVKGMKNPGSGGNILVNFKESSYESYGQSQSYNSSISINAAAKYVETLNYLLRSSSNHMFLDDMTIVFWSEGRNNDNDDFMDALFNDNNDRIDVDEALYKIILNVKEGKSIAENLNFNIDPDVSFHIVGMKTNSSRVSVKFHYINVFGEIILNMIQHQKDIQVGSFEHVIPIWKVKTSLVSSNSSTATVSPALMDKIIRSALYAEDYPVEMLAKSIKLAQRERNIYGIRAGLIKGYINRKNRNMEKEEEIKMALDKENKNSAYLCGRLFAVMEKVQEDSSGGELNKTIKDAYFAAASGTPAAVLAKLLKKTQYHVKKISNKGRQIKYEKLIASIMNDFQGTMPTRLGLEDQGRFMLGYYQQREAFFEKNSHKEEE